MVHGPKPQPTSVRRLRGNPGKRALPKPGQEAEPAGLCANDFPDPPDWLGDYGAAEWDRVGPVLAENGLLTEADLMAFAAYCANVNLLVESVTDIEKNGTTIVGARGEVRNPALASFAAATTALRSLAAEFGMTPSSRGRIRLPGDDDDMGLDDLIGDDGKEDAA